MERKKSNTGKYLFSLLSILFFITQIRLFPQEDFYIRLNQVGFLPDDPKSAVVISQNDLTIEEFRVINLSSNQPVHIGKLIRSEFEIRNFGHNYEIDFSGLKEEGFYAIQVGTKKSTKFWISDGVFEGITDTLLKFFRVQRCGYTNPLMH